MCLNKGEISQLEKKERVIEALLKIKAKHQKEIDAIDKQIAWIKEEKTKI